MSLYVKVARLNIGKPSHIQYDLFSEYEIKQYHDKKKVIVLPDMEVEQWKKIIQECPKAFCVNFTVVSINENTMIIDTLSKASIEDIVKMTQIWVDKKYPAFGCV